MLKFHKESTICRLLYSLFCMTPHFQALQRTLEFEEELAQKFSGGTTHSRNKVLGSDEEEADEGENRNKIVSDIRKKYEKKLAVPRDGTELV